MHDFCVKTQYEQNLRYWNYFNSKRVWHTMPILQALTEDDYKNKIDSGYIQLNLFES